MDLAMLQLQVHFKSSMHIDIAELAIRSGVPASTLRHYETLGLIAPVGRSGLRRVYERARIFDQLAFIALGQRAGFSLATIAALGMQVLAPLRRGRPLHRQVRLQVQLRWRRR